MEKAYVFLADGFEEIEGLTVVDILRRAGADTQTVSVMGRKEITGRHRITLQADLVFEETSFEDGTLFVLPGGMPGKRVAAICAAPSVLGDLGLLEGKHAACYPGFEDRLKGAQVEFTPVVTDGNITTSRGMGTAIPFALSLAAQLTGTEKAEELAKGIIYK